ncbi:small RNA 2'-O-methyltransferase [Brachionichthys hirsutus]|uniref:small RNA 2'-O-methyltransferase n=1 Tax=Brachionichthys hirsutus TaxID=412623 RepID=UPI003604967C
MFRPSLHSQRHQFVIDFVKSNKPQKVVDLGCAECTLLKKLRFHREMELLVGVDVNGAKVRRKMNGLAPLAADYLRPGSDPLRVELYQGSVTQKDARLRGFDLVSSIELIEHLTLSDVETFSDVLFGFMTPVAVIVSTPNAEFNPLLPGLIGFRHSDHKFEWTRAEFQSWALKVCMTHGYEVEFTGVGHAPPGRQESVGFCSQIAVFRRLGGKVDCNVFSDDAEDVFSYSLLYSVNYPSLRDNNILRRVLVSEALYCAEKLKQGWVEERTDGRLSAHTAEGGVADGLGVYVSVPLSSLWSSSTRIRSLSGTPTNLRHFLMEDPQVKMNQDGSAVLLQHRDTEEEEQNILEDSGFAEASKSSLCTDEDW